MRAKVLSEKTQNSSPKAQSQESKINVQKRLQKKIYKITNDECL